jgi:hypothetical protein
LAAGGATRQDDAEALSGSLPDLSRAGRNRQTIDEAQAPDRAAPASRPRILLQPI